MHLLMGQEGFNVASRPLESGCSGGKHCLPAAVDQMGCTLLPVIFILLFMTPVHTYRPDQGYKRCIQTLTMCV